MNEQECGCFEPRSLNEVCPQCRAEYEEYIRVMAMLRKSVAESERKEVEHADAA
jgi:hypothetical protein